MNFLVDGLVTIGNRVGYIEDIIEDLYLVTFYDDDFNESRGEPSNDVGQKLAV